MTGPLHGVRVIEMAGIGPGPFCTMMLADAGADVLRIERRNGTSPLPKLNAGRDRMDRGRRVLTIDLKADGAAEVVLKLIEGADILIEGFRPGVMERLGLGPEICAGRNPRLVYGRMTGWGQDGPLANAAGHDINYIALSGALHAIGPAERPVPPLNLVGDFGGGAMMLAFGIVCALFEARASGKGQVVDAAMTDGAALLMAPFFGMLAGGRWTDTREANLLDGGAPFYGTYRCSDGGFVSIGALEPQFYDLFLKLMEIDDAQFLERADPSLWPQLRSKLEQRFATRTRDDWCKLLEGTDVCFAPVLSLAEAPHHPHNRSRNAFVDLGGTMQPAPAPRFGRTASEVPQASQIGVAVTDEILAEAGFDSAAIAGLRAAGIVTN